MVREQAGQVGTPLGERQGVYGSLEPGAQGRSSAEEGAGPSVRVLSKAMGLV